MQNKRVISNHWDMFSTLIRLSDMIGEASPKETLPKTRRYTIYEKVFYKSACERLGVKAIHGTYYTVIKYKGKNYEFKVACYPDDETCSIYWTTTKFGWTKDGL